MDGVTVWCPWGHFILSTQEVRKRSQHGRTFVDWDVNHQHKQNNNVEFSGGEPFFVVTGLEPDMLKKIIGAGQKMQIFRWELYLIVTVLFSLNLKHLNKLFEWSHIGSTYEYQQHGCSKKGAFLKKKYHELLFPLRAYGILYFNIFDSKMFTIWKMGPYGKLISPSWLS